MADLEPIEPPWKRTWQSVWPLLLPIGLIICWLAWGLWAKSFASWAMGDSVDAVGVWGDSFGAFNALVSSFAFIAVVMTLRSQSRSIRIQQAALQQQQNDLHRERFENTFFEMLKLLRNCRDEVEYENQKGLMAFNSASNEIRNNLRNSHMYNGIGCLDSVQFYHKMIHRFAERSLSPYFRVIYRILHRLREDSILSSYEKLSYAKLLRGQISSDELVLISLNGKLRIAKDFSSLIEEFRMLKYLPKDELRSDIEKFYSASTFLGHED